MASKRTTGDLLEIIEQHSKEIRKLKRHQKRVVELPEWEFYIPELTATTTNPDLGGTGSTRNGWFIRFGELAIVRFRIEFGDGASAGDGGYRISLPADCPASSSNSRYSSIGQAVLFDWSVAGHKELAACYRSTSTTFSMYVDNATVSHNTPFTWANDDKMGGTIIYEAF